MFVGIDVSKDRLDVHLRPSGEAFAVSRDGAGIAALVDRLGPLAPALCAIARRSINPESSRFAEAFDKLEGGGDAGCAFAVSALRENSIEFSSR